MILYANKMCVAGSGQTVIAVKTLCTTVEPVLSDQAGTGSSINDLLRQVVSKVRESFYMKKINRNKWNKRTIYIIG